MSARFRAGRYAGSNPVGEAIIYRCRKSVYICAVSRPRNIGEAVRARLEARVPYNAIALELGVSKGTLGYHAKRMGISIPWVHPRRRRGTPKRTACIVCGSAIGSKAELYCSHKCRTQRARDIKIAMWKAGRITGYDKAGGLSSVIRQYILDTRGERCELCGWCEVNPATGRVPVTVDHIDGRWQNTVEENLRVLCPNCHSLTPTYQALNKGNGHPYRRKHYRQQTRRVLAEKEARLAQPAEAPASNPGQSRFESGVAHQSRRLLSSAAEHPAFNR